MNDREMNGKTVWKNSLSFKKKRRIFSRETKKKFVNFLMPGIRVEQSVVPKTMQLFKFVLSALLQKY